MELNHKLLFILQTFSHILYGVLVYVNEGTAFFDLIIGHVVDEKDFLFRIKMVNENPIPSQIRYCEPC